MSRQGRSELFRVHALHALEESGKGGGLGKVELLGYLTDAHGCLAQEEDSLHEQELVDVVDDGASA